MVLGVAEELMADIAAAALVVAAMVAVTAATTDGSRISSPQAMAAAGKIMATVLTMGISRRHKGFRLRLTTYMVPSQHLQAHLGLLVPSVQLTEPDE